MLTGHDYETNNTKLHLKNKKIILLFTLFTVYTNI